MISGHGKLDLSPHLSVGEEIPMKHEKEGFCRRTDKIFKITSCLPNHGILVLIEKRVRIGDEKIDGHALIVRLKRVSRI